MCIRDSYVAVFFKKLVTQLTVGIPTFVVVTGLLVLYLNHLKKSYFKKIDSSEAVSYTHLDGKLEGFAIREWRCNYRY